MDTFLYFPQTADLCRLTDSFRTLAFPGQNLRGGDLGQQVSPCWYYGVAELELSGSLFIHEGGFPGLVAIGDPLCQWEFKLKPSLLEVATHVHF